MGWVSVSPRGYAIGQVREDEAIVKCLENVLWYCVSQSVENADVLRNFIFDEGDVGFPVECVIYCYTEEFGACHKFYVCVVYFDGW